MYGIDVRSKRFYYIVMSILNVLSLVTSEFISDENNRLNEIYKLTNFSENQFEQNSELNNEKIGLFVFTQYCGPGERIWKTISGQEKLPNPVNTYADIDVCCKRHDECPNYIVSSSDYERYVGLPQRSQLFARYSFKKFTVLKQQCYPSSAGWNVTVMPNSLVV